MRKLNPCPFCKDENPALVYREKDKEYFIICTRCGAEGPHTNFVADANAATAWNWQENWQGKVEACIGRNEETMRLKEEQPDSCGWWWCWKEGMKKAEILKIEMDSNAPFYYYKGPFARGPEHISTSGYTHFAGPVEQPDMPGPSRHETKGAVMSLTHADGCSAKVFFADPVPESFVSGLLNVPLKITLEREQVGDE